jgi:hypothetical protein
MMKRSKKVFCLLSVFVLIGGFSTAKLFAAPDGKQQSLVDWIGYLIYIHFIDHSEHPNGGLQLIDANGNAVAIFWAKENLVFDPSLEFVYQVDYWTGLSEPRADTAPKSWESADCTGSWYPPDYHPHTSFTVAGGDPQVYVVTEVGTRTIQSYDDGSGCSPSEPEETQVGTAFQAVTIPGPFPAPLHLEAR